jgi:hypothetical protein
MDFYSELACAMTGTDEPATAKWLAAYCKDTAAIERAALHWQHADERLRDALASQLGFTEPNGERWKWPLRLWPINTVGQALQQRCCCIQE